MARQEREQARLGASLVAPLLIFFLVLSWRANLARRCLAGCRVLSCPLTALSRCIRAARHSHTPAHAIPNCSPPSQAPFLCAISQPALPCSAGLRRGAQCHWMNRKAAQSPMARTAAQQTPAGACCACVANCLHSAAQVACSRRRCLYSSDGNRNGSTTAQRGVLAFFITYNLADL